MKIKMTYGLALGILFGHVVVPACSGEMPPDNDAFENAALIEGTTGSTNGSLVGATSEDDDPEYFFGNATIWWKWIAPEGGKFSFDTFGSNVNTSIGVYRGESLDSMSVIREAANKVTITAVENMTYYVAIASYESEEGDQIVLNWGPLVAEKPNLPMMVYNYRWVLTSEGYAHQGSDDEDNAIYGWQRRSTFVESGLLIRDRSDEAELLTKERSEGGGFVAIEFFSVKSGAKITRYYNVIRGELIIADDYLWSGIESQLVRFNTSKRGVAEVIWARSFGESGRFGIIGLGAASRRRIVAGTDPVWFASKLTRSFDGGVAPVLDLPDAFVAGQPANGRRESGGSSLVFNAKETNRISGATNLDDALALILLALKARGYSEYAPDAE